jgi:hypothetical protein
MPGGVIWNATDRTGGPVDDVFAALRRSFTDLHIERLAATHPADDDNVWFLTRQGKEVEVQIDSMPNGSPPFLLESDVDSDRASDAETAVEILSRWLRH